MNMLFKIVIVAFLSGIWLPAAQAATYQITFAGGSDSIERFKASASHYIFSTDGEINAAGPASFTALGFNEDLSCEGSYRLGDEQPSFSDPSVNPQFIQFTGQAGTPSFDSHNDIRCREFHVTLWTGKKIAFLRRQERTKCVLYFHGTGNVGLEEYITRIE